MTPNEICNSVHQSSPIHFSVLANNYASTKILLQNGAHVNHRDAEGNTPIHLAVAKRNINLVQLLEDYHCDATIKNIDNISALDVALTEDLPQIKAFYMGKRKYAEHI